MQDLKLQRKNGEATTDSKVILVFQYSQMNQFPMTFRQLATKQCDTNLK